jgi:hypothetical protein
MGMRLSSVIRLLTFMIAAAIGHSADAASMVINSFDGPVTSAEVQSFKSFIRTMSLPTSSWGGAGNHNEIMDGLDGQTVEAMGLIYEITGDKQILDRMIEFVDRFVSLRNDLPAGAHRRMWDGIVHKTWLPSFPGMRDNTACGDHEDTVGHICYCAELILKSQSLLDQEIPDGDSYRFGRTYRARALTFIQKCDENDDDFSLPIFIDARNRIRQPPNWPASAHNVDASNIQAMWRNGFLRSEECHELLGDAPARAAKYHAINQVSINTFLHGLQPYTVNGRRVFRWRYFADKSGIESTNLHGAYDILGIDRAYRNGTFSVPTETMTALANTLINVIYKGNRGFAESTDGGGGVRNELLGYWMLLSQFNKDVFKVTAPADAPRRGSTYQTASPYNDAVILWVKYHRSNGDFPE